MNRHLKIIDRISKLPHNIAYYKDLVLNNIDKYLIFDEFDEIVQIGDLCDQYPVLGVGGNYKQENLSLYFAIQRIEKYLDNITIIK